MKAKYFFILFLLSFFLLGCTKTQSDLDSLDIAVFSDIHGSIENVKKFSEELNKDIDTNLNNKDVSNGIDNKKAYNDINIKEIDMIIVPGDISEHFRNNINDKQEIKLALEELIKIEKDIYLIPGNHDDLNDLKEVINEINSPLIHDMTNENILDLREYRVLFIPGYFIKELSADGAFVYDKDFLDNLENELKKDNSKIKTNILVSHGPPKIGGIDLALSKDNVGDAMLAEFIENNNISFGIFGHIHEAVGGADINGNKIKENELSDSLFVNSGSVLEWERNDGKVNSNIVIIKLNGRKASYNVVEG